MKLKLVAGIVAACVSVTAVAESSPDQIIDEFLKALPPAETVRPDVDPAELARLNALNPGRDADITPILATYGRCIRPAVESATTRMMRSLAVGLGPTKTAKLTEFYRGPDYPIYLQLLAKAGAGGVVAGTNSVTAARLLRTYPIVEFDQALRDATSGASKDDAFLAAATKCSLAKRDGLIRAKLKYRP